MQRSSDQGAGCADQSGKIAGRHHPALMVLAALSGRSAMPRSPIGSISAALVRRGLLRLDRIQCLIHFAQ